MTVKIVQKIYKNVGNVGNVVWFVFIYIKNFFLFFCSMLFIFFSPVCIYILQNKHLLQNSTKNILKWRKCRKCRMVCIYIYKKFFLFLLLYFFYFSPVCIYILQNNHLRHFSTKNVQY